MIRKLVFTCLLAALFTIGGNAQPYNTSAGIRLGLFNGLTVKHFIEPDRALEGLLSWRWDGFVVTGLYEFQKPLNIEGVSNLDWYIGGGAHIGFWGANNYYYGPADRVNSYTVGGLDFILGMEYTFDEVPITLSLDWKPAFNIFGDSHWWGDGGAFSVRYVF